MDFGALPPEVNSGRMYSGAGSGPMLAAAAAWEALAAELGSTASSYDTVISGLTGGAWSGPSSTSMAAAAAPYVAWMSATAAHAEQTAVGARAAATAYEAAFTATVPPPVIAANRSLLTSLIATNILGQNTPAIAATDAHYAEMWAQDAAAMYGYAGSSAAAAQVIPFDQPPQTTNPAGASGQAASVAQAGATAAGSHAQALPQLLSSLPQSLQSLATPVTSAAPAATTAADPSSFLTALNSFVTGPLSPASLFTVGGVPFLLGVQSYLLPQASANLTSAAEKVSTLPPSAVPEPERSMLGMGSPAAGSASASRLSAGLGGAGRIAGMSVPSSWTSAAPAIKTAAAMLPETNLNAAPAVFAAEGQEGMFSNLALSSLAGRGMVGTGGGGAARSVGAASGSGAKEVATTANIFVIHEAE